MALKHVYIDESLSSGGGGQSVSDPYSSLALALSSESQNTSGGTQFNIKSVSSGGASVVQSTSTDLNTQLTWSPNGSSPVIFRGYDNTENDGGKFDIDLDARTTDYVGSTSLRDLHFIDGKFHNSQSKLACKNTIFDNIHFDDFDSRNVLEILDYVIVRNCHFSNVTSDRYHVYMTRDCIVKGCFFDGRHGSGTSSMLWPGNHGIVNNCIFVCEDDTTSSGWKNAIRAYANPNDALYAHIRNCSFLKLGKTSAGFAIQWEGSSPARSFVVNNLFEGFTTAISQVLADKLFSELSANSFYDNTTDMTYPNDYIKGGNNESLTSSPFEKSGTLSYANRAQYFAPADVGNVRTGGYSPHGASGITRGAIPFAGTGGTGGSQHPLFASRSHPLLNS